MTRNSNSRIHEPGETLGPERAVPAPWRLQDAKARFSELVRKVRSEGPQHVTVHGRDEVVVISVEEFRRLQGQRTGADLIAAMQAGPYPDIELTERGTPMPVRLVEL
jgi:prevent-host-death family protein